MLTSLPTVSYKRLIPGELPRRTRRWRSPGGADTRSYLCPEHRLEDRLEVGEAQWVASHGALQEALALGDRPRAATYACYLARLGRKIAQLRAEVEAEHARGEAVIPAVARRLNVRDQY